MATKYIWLDVTVRDVLARYEVGETIGVGGEAIRLGAKYHVCCMISGARDYMDTMSAAEDDEAKHRGLHVVRAGFAVVKKGKDRDTGEIVAIKVVDKWRYATEDNSEREIRILSKVSHQHCIALHAVYVTSRKVYIITELVSGGELLDRVTEKGVFSEPEAAYVLRQVLEGVAYLHKKGIVHRDLKLENLLLVDSSPKSHVKIADFGLSKIFSKETTLSTICGSPQYMAPELLMMEEKAQEYSPAVDIWSVGVILFILLSGYSPFDLLEACWKRTLLISTGFTSPSDIKDDNNDAALFEKIKTGKYDNNDPVWDKVSDGAKDLVAKMLTVNAEVRLSAEECLEHPWLQEQAAIMDALPNGAPPPPLPEAAVKALQQRDDNPSRIFSVRQQRVNGNELAFATEQRKMQQAADEELAEVSDTSAETAKVGECGFDAASYL